MIFLMYEITFLDIIRGQPGALLFVFLLSTATALISAALTKLLVDTDEIERKQRQIKAHELEKEKIIELANIDVNRYQKARKRWERKDVILKQTQQKMSMSRLKPTCITFIPLMIIMFAISPLFIDPNNNAPIGVALSPMNPAGIPLLGQMIAVGVGPWISYTAWYMLCSLTMNSIIQRAFKIQTQTSGGGLSQMMSGQKAKALVFPDV